jgi:NitT/TauT family transport system permease protein
VGARQRILSLLPSILVVLVGVVLLQVLLPILGVPSFIIPLPSAVFSQYLNPNIPWTTHVVATFSEVIGGYLLAVVGGIALGIGIALFRHLRAVIQPIILAAQVVPKVAFAPILFLWFGLNLLPRLMTVFLVCFFPIVVDTSAGLVTLDRDMVDLVRTFDSSRITLLVKAQLPNALPQIFAGLKVAATLALVGAVVSEFIAANEGLGFLIAASQVSLNTSLMFAAAGLLIVGGFVLYGSIALVERLLIPWGGGDDA